MATRTIRGTVVSDACHKTVTILVERHVKHPLYKKYIRRCKKIAAHDEDNRYKKGDIVKIRECAPISKSKHFIVVEQVT
ncbi:MAG: 30S ribosomal protein S17 [Alphaproteobacteria bacterium GM7ARS4]|nr:30S ribosomal protein S17 [Alphaproteobacteria bacterium GM7ARS4]